MRLKSWRGHNINIYYKYGEGVSLLSSVQAELQKLKPPPVQPLTEGIAHQLLPVRLLLQPALPTKAVEIDVTYSMRTTVPVSDTNPCKKVARTS